MRSSANKQATTTTKANTDNVDAINLVPGEICIGFNEIRVVKINGQNDVKVLISKPFGNNVKRLLS